MKLIYSGNIIFSLLAIPVLSSKLYYPSPLSMLIPPTSDEIPVVQSGNYLIAGCGDKTDTVVTVLQQLWAGLQTALKTPTTGIVYSKFFSGVDPNIVNTVLTNIALGTNVPSNGKTWQPTIICTNPDMPEIANHWNLCQQSVVQGTHQRNTQYVLLCPRIFELKSVPDATDCVGPRANGMLSTGQGLARSVMAILLHELVHMYLDPQHLPQDYYGIHAVLDLPASESVINPPNYVFYVASTSIRIVISSVQHLLIVPTPTDIMAHCTTFNPPENLRPPERILLDGGSNTTYNNSAISAFDVEFTPSTTCANDPLEAGFGDCPGLKASATFTVVAEITSGSLVGASSSASTLPDGLVASEDGYHREENQSSDT